MKWQEQRSAFSATHCRLLTKRSWRILPGITAARAMRSFLLRGQLPLLLLLSGLQSRTESSEIAIKMNFDLAPDSFDDQYQGCSKEVMEELKQGDYFMKELQALKNYSKIWQNAHLTWLNHAKALPKSMTISHAVAILIYTLNSNVRSDFMSAMTRMVRSPQQYEHSFPFKYLHYYLTSAIQLLRKNTDGKNNSLCFEVHHGTKDVSFKAYKGATIRFGQFLPASLIREEAERFGNQTLFTIQTCLGAPVQDFSLKKEVLIPPYEFFEVINMSYYPRGYWVQLQSAGNQSTYNCQLLKDFSKKYNPAPTVIALLFFFTSAIVYV
ncbi:ecto-ADP-ribosyltransferase 4 isoform X1 [Ochotona curzoniae]|uniref:ecto-ADP-ribosyltransferase 4 isoform X1 n=1 Tax=Ochotona curzoniae TaxID=130825 RepID=UPI001B349B2E|nr:ecto-ADP-ribosyltransferase 4 isoform X1 [Ochotona curzoniae]